MWRVTGARRFWRILTFRARWGGSRAYSQYDWTLARLLLLRLWLVSGAGAGAQAHQRAATWGAEQRAWLWVAALFESADGLAACEVCVATDRLQLSRALYGRFGGGLGACARGGEAWRGRRCGHATGALH